MGKSLARPALGLAVVCLGTVGAALDSAVNIALPSISGAFGIEIQDIRWIVIAYVLTYSSLLLIFGKLGDLFGYRLIFRLGLIVSAAGFAACSFAPQYGLLLAGRMLQGVGIALTLSCAPALATTLYDERERTRVLAIYAAATAAANALGPIAGGLLVDRFGWSAVFWARAPLALAALALSFLIPQSIKRPMPGQFDLVGALLLVIWLAALLLGVAAASTNIGIGVFLGLMGLAVVTFAVFVLHERRHPEPIIQPALFANFDFTAINLISIAVNYAAFSILLLVPYYLARVRGLDAGAGGLLLALAAIGTVCGSSLAGRVGKHVAVGRLTLAGIALSLAGLGGIAAFTRSADVLPVAVAMLIQGFGLGLFQVAYVDRVLAVLPLKDRGVAGSLAMVTRTIGVVAAATGHSALHRMIERTALAAGATPRDAFLAGFEMTFGVAALVVLAALLLAMLRPGTWR